MRALLASPLGFLIGVALGAVGGGGSILAVPALVYVAGQAPRAATTTSLVIVGGVAAVGAVSHGRAQRVRAGPGVLFGIVGSGGSLVGSALNRHLSPHLLLLAFSVLILGAGWRMWPRSGDADARASAGAGGGSTVVGQRVSASGVAVIVAAATVVGFLTGLFGVGGGFVVVPALVLALGYEMPVAVGTSLVVIAINSAVALADRVTTTGIAWHVALPFLIAGLAGAETGKRIADRASGPTLARWFAVLLVAVALYTAGRSLA